MNNGGGRALILSKWCSVGLLRNPRDAHTLHPNPRQTTAVLAGLSVTVLESQSLPNRDPPRQDVLHSSPPRWPWAFVLTLLGTEGTDWGQEKESPVMVGQPRPLFMCPLSTIACTLGVSRLWRDLGRSSLSCIEEAKPGEIWESTGLQASASFYSKLSSFPHFSSLTNPVISLWKTHVTVPAHPSAAPTSAPFSVKQRYTSIPTL